MKRDISRVVSPRTVLTTAPIEAKIGIVKFIHLSHLVTVYAKLNLTVLINEVTLSAQTLSVKKQTLFSFRRGILAILPCEDVTIGELHLAPGDFDYYRHVVCHQSDLKKWSTSPVRASMCTKVVEEGAAYSTICEKVKGVLQKKLDNE